MKHSTAMDDAAALSEREEARRDSLQRIGERLRWIREAYEAREPLRHSQAQWARALRISKEMLNRIELGRTQAAMHILQRIIYFSGASPGFVLFGVVGDGYMADWLERALLAAHPHEVSSFPRFREERARNLQLVAAPEERQSGAGRSRYRRSSPTS